MADDGAGPVVAITGGLSGIGAATAAALARRQAYLALWDTDLRPAAAVLATIRSAGGDGHAEVVDVRDADDVATAAARLVERHGRIDVLVASAGVADQSSTETGDPRRWRSVVDTNLLGSLFSVRAVLPMMRARGHGDIVLISSISGRISYPGEPAYIASKWGQVGFAHALREEVAPFGVRVTVIEPGLVNTPLTRDNPAVAHLLRDTQPLSAAHVAEAVVFACQQPAGVLVSELVIRPLTQPTPTFAPVRSGTTQSLAKGPLHP